jgi:hypothetical protein
MFTSTESPVSRFVTVIDRPPASIAEYPDG